MQIHNYLQWLRVDDALGDLRRRDQSGLGNTLEDFLLLFAKLFFLFAIVILKYNFNFSFKSLKLIFIIKLQFAKIIYFPNYKVFPPF